VGHGAEGLIAARVGELRTNPPGDGLREVSRQRARGCPTR
jgi:hypothetical protein